MMALPLYIMLHIKKVIYRSSTKLLAKDDIEVNKANNDGVTPLYIMLQIHEVI